MRFSNMWNFLGIRAPSPPPSIASDSAASDSDFMELNSDYDADENFKNPSDCDSDSPTPKLIKKKKKKRKKSQKEKSETPIPAENCSKLIKTKLWDHQRKTAERVLKGVAIGKRGFADASAVGAGKTLSALATFCYLLEVLDIFDRQKCVQMFSPRARKSI